jgi:hypothetical protein
LGIKQHETQAGIWPTKAQTESGANAAARAVEDALAIS